MVEMLLGLENQSEYQMDSDLTRRIRNFNLSADQYLIPLFEAISNSMHAIQERFGKSWTDKGRVQIEFIREQNVLKKIVVTDNGIGLNDYNFDSFLKTDSDYKKSKGGKGLGRFSWLLAFNEIKITSGFVRGDEHWLRAFNFSNRTKPVHNHTLIKDATANIGTNLELSDFKKAFLDKYESTTLEAIAKSTISHFILTMFTGVPDILFIDGDNELNIKEYWDRSVVDSKTEKMDEVLGISITHLMLKPGITSKNIICISANYRSVESNDIGKLLGLKNALYYRRSKESDIELCHYVGVLSGDLFDRATYSERTGLSIAKDLLNQIISNTVDFLKRGYLKTYYDNMMQERLKTLQVVINENPKFSYLIGSPESFASQLNVSSTTKMDIYKDLSAKDYSETQAINEEIQDIINRVDSGQDVEMKDVASRATQKNQSVLAEYVKSRKSILDLLERRRGWKDKTTKKNFLESDIHSVICPMKVDSDDLTIDGHNLWVLDDRLAYYEYFASDKQIRAFLEGAESEKRPDIALFKGCNAFQRERSNNQPVVIIEFKRPERDDYSEEENPIKQVLDYIEDFRNKRVRKSDGQIITTIDDNTPFQCYIVCDITPNLFNFMKLYDDFEQYPDKHGFRSYRKNYNAMIDIISFENLIVDARLRNEIFFEKLGLLDK